MPNITPNFDAPWLQGLQVIVSYVLATALVLAFLALIVAIVALVFRGIFPDQVRDWAGKNIVTVFIAKIDLRHGRATYCSAGHPPTMLLRRDASGGVEAELLSVQSGVVGAFPSMVYENGAFAFNPGDILFMYTDGAIEARDASGGFFGEARLRETLLRSASAGIDGLCSKVLAELDAFTGSALDDDIALVALRMDES